MEPIYIDVAIPHYNSPFLSKTLDSILQQTSELFSLNIYVVDDGSKNESLTKLQPYYEKSGVKFHFNDQNLGLVGNFNRCLEMSTHNYVHVMHADDILEPDFYHRVATEINKDSTLCLIACASQTFDGKNYRQPPKVNYNTKGLFEHLKFRNCLAASAVVLKTAVAKEMQFKKYAPHTSDWDMWTRVTANFPSLYITDVLHTYRTHESNDTRNFSDIDILKLELLFQQKMLQDGIFTKRDILIGKNGLAHSSKYRIAQLLLHRNIIPAVYVVLFMLKNVGFRHAIIATLGAAKVLLSKLKHTLINTQHAN